MKFPKTRLALLELKYIRFNVGTCSKDDDGFVSLVTVFFNLIFKYPSVKRGHILSNLYSALFQSTYHKLLLLFHHLFKKEKNQNKVIREEISY